jgi:hypothetical protein
LAKREGNGIMENRTGYVKVNGNELFYEMAGSDGGTRLFGQASGPGADEVGRHGGEQVQITWVSRPREREIRQGRATYHCNQRPLLGGLQRGDARLGEIRIEAPGIERGKQR